jgi:AHBA synthesis associated protein
MARKLVIFDLDGTLVDTREVMRGAYAAACKAANLASPPPFEEYVQHLGAPLTEILTRMGLPAMMAPHFKATARRLLHLASISPDLLAGLRQLHKQQCTLAVFTGKDGERTQEMLQHFSIASLFEVVLTGDDVSQGKPDPEGLIEILARTDTHSTAAVYVGDSRYDIMCAHRAGVASVGVCWGMASFDELDEARPTFLVHCQSDLFALIAAFYHGGESDLGRAYSSAQVSISH